MTEPYVEITCSDCGVVYEPEDGCCPACGSANCSYDAALMAEYQRWEWLEESLRDTYGP